MSRLQLPDFEMAYHDSGHADSDATPIVLVHGLGSSALDWQSQTRALLPHHRVITCDLRGHGESTRPEGPYRMRVLADDVAALIKHIGLQRAHVVGISLGGMIGFQLALDHPELVGDLVIINSGPAVIPRGFKQHLAIAQRRLVLNLLGLQLAGRLVEGKLFPLPEQAHLREAFRARWQRNDRASYRATLEAIIGWSVRDRLQQLTHRTLIISGDRDYTPVSVKQEYAALLPNAELVVIEHSGHATTADQPDALNAALLTFFGVDGQITQPLASSPQWMSTSATRS